jgi:hypothetical protein
MYGYNARNKANNQTEGGLKHFLDKRIAGAEKDQRSNMLWGAEMGEKNSP